MRILAMDDNVDLTNNLQKTLPIDMHDTQVFQNTEATLSTWRKEGFYFIFIDINSPECTGLIIQAYYLCR